MGENAIVQPEGGLLRSNEWAGVLRAEGKEVIAFDGGYGVINHMPHIGAYLYVPRGTQNIVAAVEAARSRGCQWVRTDIADASDFATLKNFSTTKAPHDMQPREHLIMDLSGGEEAILAGMKSKWRYNVRLAAKKDVVTHYVTKSDEDFEQILDVFVELTRKTGAKKGVSFHEREHYAAMFDALPDAMIALFIAEYKGDVIAANIVTFYGDTATYLHGGTDPEHRALMAPHLLQWDAIRAAIGRKLSYYDFGGVYSETSDAGKAGITKFKHGFTPKTEFYTMPGSYDIHISSTRYYIYRALQKLKSFIK